MYNEHTLSFEFDPEKEAKNIEKHGVTFEEAKVAFRDPQMIYVRDPKHSQKEERWFAVGKIRDGRIVTVWFTWRGDDKIRLIGAGELRKWRKAYEKRQIARSVKIKVG